MPKLSAGILLHRKGSSGAEVFLVHPGGPFWAKKDIGSWSVPKGEYTEAEDPLVAAKREFFEETGLALPKGELCELGDVKYSNKIVKVWALEGSLDARRITSNTFTMEWPPKTGRKQEFPEVDRAGWYPLAAAKEKLVKGQVPLIAMLEKQLDIEPNDEVPQLSLL